MDSSVRGALRMILLVALGAHALACNVASGKAPPPSDATDEGAPAGMDAGLDVLAAPDTFDTSSAAVDSPVDTSIEDATLEAAATDASDAGEAGPYTQQAPHCTRAPDASAPVPFDAGTDATPDVLALPQVMNSGGNVLHEPTFISVTFPGDPQADELDDFVASVGCTPYWSAIGTDYGVGEAVAGPAVRLSEQAPTSVDDMQIRSWLAQKIDSGDPLFPRPTPETVYVVWYPATTRITLHGAGSCDSFGAYHEGGQLTNGTPFAYVVVPRCPVDAGQVQVPLTVGASHELIEACTDPQIGTQPTYDFEDRNHWGPALGMGSEVGDLCEMNGDAVFQPQGFPWQVQRTWSNQSAWLGNDPCAPAPSTGYMYAAPMVADSITFSVAGVLETVAAVHVPVGTSVMIGVRLMGNGSGAFTVQARDVPQIHGQTPKLTFSFGTARTLFASGVPGDTIPMTITKVSSDATKGAEPFVLLATPNNAPNSYTAFWAITSD